MRIKITAELPVAAEVRPEIGSTHEVVQPAVDIMRPMYFIRIPVSGTMATVGVLPKECEVCSE